MTLKPETQKAYKELIIKLEKLKKIDPDHEIIKKFDGYIKGVLPYWFNDDKTPEDILDKRILGQIGEWDWEIDRVLKNLFINPSPTENIIKRSQLKQLIREVLDELVHI